MTWTFAKDHCGFDAVNGTRNYTQTVTILRKYNLNGILQRTEQTTRSLYIVFPSEVTVAGSNVTVSFPDSDAYAAITFIDYDPSTLLWTVQVQTTLSSPYYLSVPSLVSLTGNLAQRTPSVSITPCTTIGSTCVQTITYTYPQGSVSDPCVGLSGIDKHSFSVSCTTASCPSSGNFNVSLSLNTGDACPATDIIEFSQSSLTAYSEPTLAIPASSFTINDKIYFGASVQTNEALISSRTLRPNSVCFLPSNGPCFYPTYSVAAPTSGKDPVFVVDLKDAWNAAYFENSTEVTLFTVSAVVEVDFVGAKGLLKNVPQSQSVQTVTHAVIDPTSETLSPASMVAPVVSLCLLLLAILL